MISMEKRLLTLRESRDVLQQQRRKIRKEKLAKDASKRSTPVSLFQDAGEAPKSSEVVRLLHRFVTKVKGKL